MFWIIILILIFAVVFMKLGAYSVLTTFLLLGLKGALVVVAILGLILLWRKVSG